MPQIKCIFFLDCAKSVFCCRLENPVDFIYSLSVIYCFGFGSFDFDRGDCGNNKNNNKEITERSHIMELVVVDL